MECQVCKRKLSETGECKCTSHGESIDERQETLFIINKASIEDFESDIYDSDIEKDEKNDAEGAGIRSFNGILWTLIGILLSVAVYFYPGLVPETKGMFLTVTFLVIVYGTFEAYHNGRIVNISRKQTEQSSDYFRRSR